MYSLRNMFLFALILSITYAFFLGGKTGRLGALIFAAATALTFAAAAIDPGWNSTKYAIFAIDAACLVALAVLAMWSDRYWPIWALGFQLITVVTHMATIWAPDILPRIYQAMATFWSVPILSVMVIGSALDRRFQKAGSGPP